MTMKLKKWLFFVICLYYFYEKKNTLQELILLLYHLISGVGYGDEVKKNWVFFCRYMIQVDLRFNGIKK